MNIITNIHLQFRRGALRGAAVAVLCMGAANAWAACTANTVPFMSTPASVPHEGFRSGDRLNSTGANVALFRDCDRFSGADLSVGPALAYVGEVAGIPTFRTVSSAVGVQLRYRYLETASSSGETWSDWFYVSDSRRSFHAKASYNRDTTQTALPFAVEVFFIALRDINSYETVSIGDLDPPFNLQDHSYGEDLAGTLVTGFTIRPYRYASCWFTSRPPSTLQLASTSVVNLSAEGDLGPAVDFSFAWKCESGDDRGGGADFQFTSSKALGTSGGLLSVDGDASGVDMLVTMKGKDGKQIPVPLGTHWWASHHYGVGRSLPDESSQEMQVRFRKNKDVLKPGNASSTMTVHLSLF